MSFQRLPSSANAYRLRGGTAPSGEGALCLIEPSDALKDGAASDAADGSSWWWWWSTGIGDGVSGTSDSLSDMADDVGEPELVLDDMLTSSSIMMERLRLCRFCKLIDSGRGRLLRRAGADVSAGGLSDEAAHSVLLLLLLLLRSSSEGSDAVAWLWLLSALLRRPVSQPRPRPGLGDRDAAGPGDVASGAMLSG